MFTKFRSTDPVRFPHQKKERITREKYNHWRILNSNNPIKTFELLNSEIEKSSTHILGKTLPSLQITTQKANQKVQKAQLLAWPTLKFQVFSPSDPKGRTTELASSG